MERRSRNKIIKITILLLQLPHHHHYDCCLVVNLLVAGCKTTIIWSKVMFFCKVWHGPIRFFQQAQQATSLFTVICYSCTQVPTSHLQGLYGKNIQAGI